MRTKVIAHILPWANIAGTEIATLRLADAARTAGYDNVLYLPDGAQTDHFEAFAASYGFRMQRYQQVVPERAQPWRYGRNVIALAASFRRNRVGLVHCSEVGGAYYAALAGRLAGARVITHVRCDHFAPTRLERWLLAPVQHAVFVSRDTRDASPLPFSRKRSEVLYDGVVLPLAPTDRGKARSHYHLPHDAFVIGMAGRFNPQKDHETLVQAAHLLAGRHSHIRILLVGDHLAPGARDCMAQIEAAMHLTGTRPLFHFAGLETQMERFYAAIDVKVLATHFEGLPLVLLEAMAAGKPVVASCVSGIPEVVEDGKTGLLVPPRRPAALAAALGELVDRPDLAHRLGQAGRARVQADFSDAAYVRNVAALYRRQLGSSLTPLSAPAPDHSAPCARTAAASDPG